MRQSSASAPAPAPASASASASAMATMAATSCAQDLQALKADLQLTLARLGELDAPPVQPTPSQLLYLSPWTLPSTTATMTSPMTTISSTSPMTVRSHGGTTETIDSPEREHRRGSEPPASWMMDELVATARQRREAETRLLRDLQRQAEEEQHERRRQPWHWRAGPAKPICRREETRCTGRGRSREGGGGGDVIQAMRDEITALRQRRKQIMQQIDDESVLEEYVLPRRLLARKKDRGHDLAQKAAPPVKHQPASESAVPIAHDPVQPSETHPSRGQETKMQSTSSASGGQPREYAVAGVVTLAPSHTVSSSSASASAPPALSQTTAAPAEQPPVYSQSQYEPRNSERAARVRMYHSQMAPPPPRHDTLQDVFSIQLQFAETMLRLEKSIQRRDHLLQPTGTVTTAQLRRRRASAPPRRRFEVMPLQPPETPPIRSQRPVEGDGGGEESTTRASLGSLAVSSSGSTSEATARVLRRYQQRQRAHTAVPHARVEIPIVTRDAATAMTPPQSATMPPTPSTGGSGNTTAPSSTPESHATGAATTAAQHPEKQDHQEEKVEEDANILRTPEPRRSRVRETRRYGSDTKEDATGEQVRFHNQQEEQRRHNEEYSTPVIARNICFDDASMDSSDDDDDEGDGDRDGKNGHGDQLDNAQAHATEEQQTRFSAASTPRNVALQAIAAGAMTDEEVLSFMEDASVCSNDLNDESFLAAFAALRNELREEQRAAKAPFLCSSPSPLQHDAPPSPQDEVARPHSNLDVMDVAALKANKRSIGLDIQELTARMFIATDVHERQQIASQRESLCRAREKIDLRMKAMTMA